jgi:hypothetical protein
MPVSSLEATPNTRLFDLWLEQHMFRRQARGEGWSAGRRHEFILSDGGGFFSERHLGLAVDHRRRHAERRSGLSAATPGVRVAVTPNDKVQLLVGV